MKKTMKILIALMVAITVVGCDSKTTTQASKDIYNNAVEASRNAEYVDMTTNTDIVFTSTTEDLNMDMSMTVDYLSDSSDKDNLKLLFEIKTNMLGQETEMTTYYMDGYSYAEIMGQKFKMKIPLEEVLDNAGVKTQFIKAEDMSEFSMEEKDDTYIFTYVAKEEAMMEILKNASGLGAIYGEEMDMQGVNINSMSGTTTISKEGKVISELINVDASIEEGGVTVGFVMKNNTIYNSINEPLEITLPNVDEYIEMDESDMFAS